MKEKNFEPLEKFAERNSIRMPLTKEHMANINVSEKNGYFLYNYNKNVLVPMDDPIIIYCRGLVLNGDGYVINMPFKRFFNAHESQCATIDWDSAEILEKLDGSLICVWWTGSEWEVTTRGSFYPNEHAHNFKETFLRLFDKCNILSQDACYIFELISKDNRIVTKYTTERAVLIGARNLLTAKEFTQDELDRLAGILEVDRPKRFKATSVDECRKLFEDMKDDEEGVVIVDKYFNRMKLKQQSYLTMSRIIALKHQAVLEYLLGMTKLDADFTDMPELKEKEAEINMVYNSVKEYIGNIFNNIKHIESQKEFASHAMNYRFSGILFKLRAGKDYEGVCFKWDKILEYANSMVIPKAHTLMILRGIPGSGKSTWIKENGLGMYVLCADDLRVMYSTPNPYISQEWNRFVWATLYAMLGTRMKFGSFVIIDAVHQTNKSLKQYRSMCEQFGYEMKIIDFKVSLEDALERNKNRETYKIVPEEVIERMHKQLTETLINQKEFDKL
jgi:predicted kinase